MTVIWEYNRIRAGLHGLYRFIQRTQCHTVSITVKFLQYHKMTSTTRNVWIFYFRKTIKSKTEHWNISSIYYSFEGRKLRHLLWILELNLTEKNLPAIVVIAIKINCTTICKYLYSLKLPLPPPRVSTWL